MKHTESQNTRILDYLKTGMGITSLTALHKFGCLRLSGRIYELKKRGEHIEKVMTEIRGKRVAAYYWMGSK